MTEYKPGQYQLVAPSVPGATPSVQGSYDTREEARAAARKLSRRRPDLRGQDVRIERNYRLVEAAGTGG